MRMFRFVCNTDWKLNVIAPSIISVDVLLHPAASDSCTHRVVFVARFSGLWLPVEIFDCPQASCKHSVCDWIVDWFWCLSAELNESRSMYHLQHRGADLRWKIANGKIETNTSCCRCSTKEKGLIRMSLEYPAVGRGSYVEPVASWLH